MFTTDQQLIIDSLKSFKPKLTSKGLHQIMTTSELHHMRTEEFTTLCKEIIPEQQDLIIAYTMKKGSTLGDIFRKSLILEIQKTYVTKSIQELKNTYPSFFDYGVRVNGKSNY